MWTQSSMTGLPNLGRKQSCGENSNADHEIDCFDDDRDVDYKIVILNHFDYKSDQSLEESSIPEQSFHCPVRDDKAGVLHRGVLKHVVDPEWS